MDFGRLGYQHGWQAAESMINEAVLEGRSVARLFGDAPPACWQGKPYGPANAPLVEFLMWLDSAQPFELEAFGLEGRVSSHDFYYDIEGWTDRVLTPSPASSAASS